MKEDIVIIDNFRDLSIGDYQEITRIYQDQSLDEMDQKVKVISILTGKSEDYLLNDILITEFKDLARKAEFVKHGQEEMEKMTARVADSYIIGRFELIPVKDIRKVNTAQYIDYQSFHQAGLEDHFVEILSCLLVPKGMKYNQDYDILEVQKAIREEMNVVDAVSLYAFFLLSCRDSIKDTLIYSRQEAMKIKDRTRREQILEQIKIQETLLMTNGDGSPR